MIFTHLLHEKCFQYQHFGINWGYYYAYNQVAVYGFHVDTSYKKNGVAFKIPLYKEIK